MFEKLLSILKSLFRTKASEVLQENGTSIKETITNFVDEHAPEVLKGQADEVVDKVMDFIEEKIDGIGKDEPAEESAEDEVTDSETTASDEEYIAN